MTIQRRELERRTDRLRTRMHAESLDALVIYSDEYRSGHSTYLTNYKPINVIEESPQLVILIGNDQPVLLLGLLNAYAARDIAWMDDVRGIHRPDEDLPEIFAPLRGRPSRIGLFGRNILPVRLFDHIETALPDGQFIPRDDIILHLRKIKSQNEIELMARAAEINDQVIPVVRQSQEECLLRSEEQFAVASASHCRMRTSIRQT